ncbi:hypothetical protein [Mesorhizobium sp.]|uniref:hypothetical protein n=1 Tax=Mesorhizobium sp. TaxID=1871066 RepID=UPI0025E0A56C|nr:hypothetical protein [Mesorhizobium sp.]
MTETSSAAAGIQEIQPAIYVLRLSAAVQVCPCGKTGKKIFRANDKPKVAVPRRRSR